MRILAALMLALLTALATASPASARVVLMEASVTLEDHTAPAIEQAIRRALNMVASGALAMGLSSMRLDDARVLEDIVIVSVVASDEEVDEPNDGNGVERQRVTQ